MYIIIFTLVTLGTGQSDCNPFNLVCNVSEFVVRVDEECLGQKLGGVNIAVNNRAESSCGIRTVNGQTELRFGYSECGTIQR